MKKRANWLLRLGSVALLAIVITACGTPRTPGDNTPDAIAFTAVTDAEPATEVTSNEVTLAGFTGELEADVDGGTLILNGDEAETPVDVTAGDTVAVRVTSSSEYETPVTATLTVGTVEADFTVTTRGPSTTPGEITFEPVTGAGINQAVTSNVVTLTGFDGELEANVTGGDLILNGDEADTPVNVSAGDEVALRVTASGEYDTPVTATLTVGDVEAEFTVTTGSEPVAPEIVTFEGPASEVDPATNVMLTWDVTGDAESLELSGGDLTAPVDVLGEAGYEVTIPEGVDEVTYTLTVANETLSVTETMDLTLSIPLWVCQDPAQEVYIDPNLEASLRAQVDSIPNVEPITCGDMRSVTEFNSNHYDGNEGEIDSLVGLQHAINLETLVVQFNEISDLRPIANLTNLEVINFDRNEVLDLTPLAGLTSLREVGFWDNGPVDGGGADGITDISVLANLTNLEVLYLSSNNISDITPLQNLTGLQVLWLIDNAISDLQALDGMDGMRSLRIGHQRGTAGFITDISPVFDMVDVAWLELQFTRPADVSFLAAFENLYVLRLEGMLLSNADVLPIVENTAFPVGTVPPADIGVNPPAAPILDLTDNCIDVTDADMIAAIEDLEDAGVTVVGFEAAEQRDSCDTDAAESTIRRNAFERFQQNNDFR